MSNPNLELSNDGRECIICLCNTYNSDNRSVHYNEFYSDDSNDSDNDENLILNDITNIKNLYKECSCKFLIHKQCLLDWLSSSPTCPMCHSEVYIVEHISVRSTENLQETNNNEINNNETINNQSTNCYKWFTNYIYNNICCCCPCYTHSTDNNRSERNINRLRNRNRNRFNHNHRNIINNDNRLFVRRIN